MEPRIRHSRSLAGLVASVLLAFAAADAAPARRPAPGFTPTDEFFIVSSIDLAKGLMVLKRPTEVTLTMVVTPKTRILGQLGKPLQLADLRAGDTLFIASERGASGQLIASSIREGPMTVQELRLRYLHSER